MKKSSACALVIVAGLVGWSCGQDQGPRLQLSDALSSGGGPGSDSDNERTGGTIGDDENVVQPCSNIQLRHVPYRVRNHYRGAGEWDGDIIHIDPEFGLVFRHSRRFGSFIRHYLGRNEGEGPYLLDEHYVALSTDPCDSDCTWEVIHGAGFDPNGNLYLAWGHKGGGNDEIHSADLMRWTGDSFADIATFHGNYETSLSGPFLDAESNLILLSFLWSESLPHDAPGVADAGWVNVWTGSEWVQLKDVSGAQILVDQSRVYFDERRKLYLGEYQGDPASLYEVRSRALHPTTPCDVPQNRNLETLGDSGFSFGGAGGNSGEE